MRLAGLSLALLALGAHAQPYPARPVTIYVGFPAGSANDNTARTLAAQLTEQFGQQFVVVNRDGAAGVIAAGMVAKMKPDGHALLWAGGGMLAAAPVYTRNIAYDPIRDFAPVSVYCYIPYVMAVHPSVPARDLRALIALAKAQPDRLAYGSTGIGGTLHLATELMLNLSGTRMLHVPYRGTPAMTLDVLAGQIDLVTSGTAIVAPHIQSGRLRAIGVTSSRRSALLPQVPTIAEGGLPGYELVGWYSVVATGGTPREIVGLLHRQMLRALEHPAVKANIAAEGALAGGNTPDEFAAFIRAEIDKYTNLIKSARLTPEAR